MNGDDVNSHDLYYIGDGGIDEIGGELGICPVVVLKSTVQLAIEVGQNGTLIHGNYNSLIS